jgi:hypothetical protein
MKALYAMKHNCPPNGLQAYSLLGSDEKVNEDKRLRELQSRYYSLQGTKERLPDQIETRSYSHKNFQLVLSAVFRYSDTVH